MTAIYSARWILPIISSPIENGAVAVDDSKIVAVGPKLEIVSRFLHAQVSDFGQAAILPGLVNAHSHLELTIMRGFLEAREHDFFAWLRKLTVTRMAMTPEDLRVSATCGAIEAVRAGITCVGDSSSLAIESMKTLRAAGLRGVVYQESFGPDRRLAGENVAKLREQIGELRGFETNLVRVGLSPHAPYTVSALQLEMISKLAIDAKLPVMMHAAESQAERSLMMEGRGAFAEGLRKRGVEWQAPGVSSIQYLARHEMLETKPLLAHCVHIDEDDLELIRRSGASIAHCPKSNAKLGHGRAPFAQFLSSQINVGLGSDSVASNNTCDILEEARFATLLARLDVGSSSRLSEGVISHRGTSPRVSKGSGSFDLSDEPGALSHDRASAPIGAEQALFAATLGGARALGLNDQIGALADGMQADIVVVGLDRAHQQPLRNPADSLIFSSSGRDVLLTMVAGKEIYRNGSVNNVDEGEVCTEMKTIRAKLDSLPLT